MLLAYPKGYPLKTTYFHRLHPNVDQRSFIVTVAMSEDTIHEDLLMIQNLEMVLESSINHELLSEDKTTQLTGSAIMYPGLEPYEGDMFYLEVGNNNFVMFTVQSVTPTTYRQERFYRIAFLAHSTLSERLYSRIQSAVTEKCYFEKKKYFGESELTFLSTESYEQLKTLEHYRKSIAQDVVNYFFVRDAGSFFRPDGIYDPYVTEFLRTKLSVLENRVRACQLVVPMLDFHRSIWYKFIDAENRSDFTDLFYKTIQVVKPVEYYSINFNGLTKKPYLQLVGKDGEVDQSFKTGIDIGKYGAKNKGHTHPDLIRDYHVCRSDHEWHHHGPDNFEWSSNNKSDHDPAGDTYIFSERFYLGMCDSGLDDIESIVHDYLVKNLVHTKKIIDITSRYRKLGRGVLAYYRLPLYLELIDAAIVAVR